MSPSRWTGAALLPLALLLCWCGDDRSPPTGGVNPDPVEPPPLLGQWETRGTDPQLGDVTVRLELEASGDLSVSLLLSGGGQLRFAGTWEASGDSIVLRGAYFQPDGEARAGYTVHGDSLLVLRQGSEASQQWRRP